MALHSAVDCVCVCVCAIAWIMAMVMQCCRRVCAFIVITAWWRCYQIAAGVMVLGLRL